jgi:hypothetical protein
LFVGCCRSRDIARVPCYSRRYFNEGGGNNGEGKSREQSSAAREVSRLPGGLIRPRNFLSLERTA